mmetsp:Transcript_861/g.990  ORF Transcript_861/g.990 Transcript_861/m.990 type:complete len:714 (+) Transcript_861:19-2160(+)
MALPIITYPKSDPPLVLLVANEFIRKAMEKDVLKFKQDPKAKDVVLRLYPSKDVITGVDAVTKFVARLVPDVCLYGTSALASHEVETWFQYASSVLSKCRDQSSLETELLVLQNHLHVRTYFAGYSVTIADIAVWTKLYGNPAWTSIYGSNKSKKYLAVTRWFIYMESFVDCLVEAKKHLDLAAASEGKVHLQHGDYKKLADAQVGKVVTRFPPEPSGYLHIGHCKAAILNATYAKQYGGKLILRFDDTNPQKEKVEFETNIKNDLKTLGITADRITHTSDYFQEILDLATKFIKQGLAYVDMTPSEELKTMRRNKQATKYRDASVADNLALWKEMQAGTEDGKKCVLRAKIDMQSNNGCLRDPNIYRFLDMHHAKTKGKFKVYPLYDFACPYVDSKEGVTHAFRSNEYHDRNPLYNWFLDKMQMRTVGINDFSRLNFTYTLISKRKLQQFVDNRLVDGWNDPRMPTVQGLFRRGLTKEGIFQFILDQGGSKNSNFMDIGKLWTINKKVIDPIIPRYTCISKDCVVVNIADGPEDPEYVTCNSHPKNKEVGTKVVIKYNKIIIEATDAAALNPEGEEATFMNWGNIQLGAFDASSKSVDANLHLDGSVKSTKYKLTWLANIPSELVPCVLVEYGPLVTQAKPDDDWKNHINKNSKMTQDCWGSPNLRRMAKGDRCQLTRRGYYICDKPSMNDSDPIVLVKIPDGRTKDNYGTK